MSPCELWAPLTSVIFCTPLIMLTEVVKSLVFKFSPLLWLKKNWFGDCSFFKLVPRMPTGFLLLERIYQIGASMLSLPWSKLPGCWDISHQKEHRDRICMAISVDLPSLRKQQLPQTGNIRTKKSQYQPGSNTAISHLQLLKDLLLLNPSRFNCLHRNVLYIFPIFLPTSTLPFHHPSCPPHSQLTQEIFTFPPS